MAENITFGIKDVYPAMNDFYRQTTGQSDINVVDTSTFISAGQKILDTGVDAAGFGMTVLMGKVLYNERPYHRQFNLIYKKREDFAKRFIKRYFYTEDAIAAGPYNTDLHSDNIGNGLSNHSGVGGMFDTQKMPMHVDRNFYSQYVWDDLYTLYEDQLKMYMRSEEEFLSWLNAYSTNYNNGLEMRLEANARTLILDAIGSLYLDRDVRPESAVNMTEVYNSYNGTSYTTQEILEEHREDFLKVFNSKIQIDSDRLEVNSVKYHDPMTKTVNNVRYDVLCHTPKSEQRLVYYKPLFRWIRNMVLPDVFNEGLIKDVQGEGVMSWQAFDTNIDDNNMKVIVKPSRPDGAQSEEVEIPRVLAILFDNDKLQCTNNLTRVISTPEEARKMFTNVYTHYRWESINDPVCPGILYYMSDSE